MANPYREWVLENREDIIRDIKRLVDVKSVKDTPQPGAPYGAGVRAVQMEAMDMCREAGLTVTDLEGHIAYGHYGDPDRFIGVVAHLDVVPEGTGWDSGPYDLTEREGFLVGRGTADDKGPFVLALWAIKYLLTHDIRLNYGIRLIMGLEEETGMGDLLYYNEHCAAPVFAFTPDADFPVGHGEKGMFGADLVSPPIQDRIVMDFAGGVAGNVVPDTATALVDTSVLDKLKSAAEGRDNIALTERPDGLFVEAKGLARHAGMPEGGISAINELLGFLLDSGVLNGEEKAAAEFMRRASGDTTGAQFGIDRADGLFTPVTIIAGTAALRDDRFVLNVNCRYNTAITPQEVQENVTKTSAESGFELRNVRNSAPYYLPPETPAVQLLTGIYNEVTGSDAVPYVMSGGTYARLMKNAVAFGIEQPCAKVPDWVGSAHMKNEAISIDQALDAVEIFIHTLVRLQDIDL